MNHFFQKIDGWASYSEQGLLLSTILSELDTSNLVIAEIGVYKGRGTAMWVVELINRGIQFDYFAVDHFLGSEEHDKGIDYYSITKGNLCSIIDKITLVNNDSISQAALYEDNYFDIVYIDASHDYHAVLADVAAWLPKVKPGGIICGDDYIMGWPGVMTAINQSFSSVNTIGSQQWWFKK